MQTKPGEYNSLFSSFTRSSNIQNAVHTNIYVLTFNPFASYKGPLTTLPVIQFPNTSISVCVPIVESSTGKYAKAIEDPILAPYAPEVTRPDILPFTLTGSLLNTTARGSSKIIVTNFF